MDKDQAIAVAFLIQTQQIIPVTLLGVALAPEFIFKRKKVTPRGRRRTAHHVANRGNRVTRRTSGQNATAGIATWRFPLSSH